MPCAPEVLGWRWGLRPPALGPIPAEPGAWNAPAAEAAPSTAAVAVEARWLSRGPGLQHHWHERVLVVGSSARLRGVERMRSAS